MALTNEGKLLTWGGTVYSVRGQGSDIRGAANKHEAREFAFFRDQNLFVTQIGCGQKHAVALAYREGPSINNPFKSSGLVDRTSTLTMGASKTQLYAWGDQEYLCGHGSSNNTVVAPKRVKFFEKREVA